MKISHLVFYSIFFILSLFAITTYINFHQWQMTQKNADYFARSTENVRITNRFQKNILYMGFGLRGYLMTGDNYFLLTYDSAKVENTGFVKELSGLISSDTMQFKKFVEITRYYNEWITTFADPLRAAKLANNLDTTYFSTLNASYKTDTSLRKQEEINLLLRKKFRDLLNTEYENRTKAKLALETSLRQTNSITFAFTVLSVVAGLLIAIVLARHVSRQIAKMSTVQDTVAEATVTGIKNLLPMLFEESAKMPPKVKEHLEAIKARIHKSYILIEAILTYAGIGKELQPKEEVNVKAIIKEILAAFPVKPNVRVELDIAAPVIQSERIALTQILTSLVSNAIKYQDKPDGFVKIYSKDLGNHYEFFVEDNGRGIEEDVQEKIFDLVQTVQDKSILDNSGIGLLIVKKILDTRKEQIRVASVPGKGSAFSFTWPKK